MTEKKRAAWTVDETLALLDGFLSHGHAYGLIHSTTPDAFHPRHRTAQALRDRLRAVLRPGFRADSAVLRERIEKVAKKMVAGGYGMVIAGGRVAGGNGDVSGRRSNSGSRSGSRSGNTPINNTPTASTSTPTHSREIVHVLAVEPHPHEPAPATSPLRKRTGKSTGNTINTTASMSVFEAENRPRLLMFLVQFRDGRQRWLPEDAPALQRHPGGLRALLVDYSRWCLRRLDYVARAEEALGEAARGNKGRVHISAIDAPEIGSENVSGNVSGSGNVSRSGSRSGNISGIATGNGPTTTTTTTTIAKGKHPLPANDELDYASSIDLASDGEEEEAEAEEDVERPAKRVAFTPSARQLFGLDVRSTFLNPLPKTSKPKTTHTPTAKPKTVYTPTSTSKPTTTYTPTSKPSSSITSSSKPPQQVSPSQKAALARRSPGAIRSPAHLSRVSPPRPKPAPKPQLQSPSCAQQ